MSSTPRGYLEGGCSRDHGRGGMLGPWLPRAGPRPRPPLLLQRLLWPDRRTSRTRPCPGRRWAGSPRCPPWMTHPLARSWETRCRVPSCLTPRSWIPLLAPPLLRWRRAARRRPTASCQVHPDPAGRLRQRASRVVVRGVGGWRGRRRCRLASSLGASRNCGACELASDGVGRWRGCADEARRGAVAAGARLLACASGGAAASTSAAAGAAQGDGGQWLRPRGWERDASWLRPRGGPGCRGAEGTPCSA